MILAFHVDGQATFVFVALVFAFIRWAATAGKKALTDEVPEAERTRRFLEALGQPAAPPVAPGREPAPGLRQRVPTREVTRSGREMPIPPIIAPSPHRPPPPPVRALRPQAPYAVPALPVLPALRTPEVIPYRTTASTVSAIAGEISSPGPAAPERENSSVAALRTLLETPGSLRTAFLLREVLGPPRGLPGSTTGPTLSLS